MTRGLDDVARELAKAQHGVFHLEQFQDGLLTPSARRHRVDVGAWEAVYPGVYRLVGAPVTWAGIVLAACWAGGRGATASHRTAASLWNLPGKRRHPIEITCRRWHRAQRDGLKVHETTSLDESGATIDGIPVTSVDRTVLDLGAVVGAVTVEMAVDAALRRELVTLSGLHDTVRRLGRSGRNGAGVLRAILDERGARAPTDSEMETWLLSLLRRNELPMPELQFIVTHNGEFLARCDAAYPAARLAIEYESYEHHIGRIALVRDSARRNQLIAAGWVVITATALDLQSGGRALCRAIQAALDREGFGVNSAHWSARV